MRSLWVSLCVVLAPAAWAGDPNACIARCTDKMSHCTKTCRDDKCVRRCADQAIPCQAICSDDGKNAYLTKDARKQKNAPPAPPKNATFPSYRGR
jgi:hypothetical protein